MPNFFFGRLIYSILFLINVIICKAEGSKDLYPAGTAIGNRAYLVSGNATQGSVSFPFMNYAEHYAFVRAGEILAVASSAQGINSGYIRLTSPSGIITTTQGSTNGVIRNTGAGTRAAELAGPRVGYTPYEIAIDASTEGIWKIEFMPTNDIGFNTNRSPSDVAANADWIQSADNNFIAAWDISVFNTSENAWVNGRVYANLLNLQINSGSISNANGAFYGKNYVLTNDGYIYRVNGNGSNGIAFSYFVNNKGFLDASRNSIYRSINSSSLGFFNIQNPRSADLPGHITHKMMYNLPALDLPETASGAVPGGATWLLKQDRATARVTNIRVVGTEGMVDYVSARFSKIFFETNLEANYKVTITSDDPQKTFTPVGIIVSGIVGLNEVIWNGKDGNGVLMPAGEKYPVKVKIELLGGEVHFPYIDMEINPNGIIIELLNDNLIDVESDIVYWDDRDINSGAMGESSSPTSNLVGLSSNINGHRWGTYRDHTIQTNRNDNYGSFSFGNEKAMDTWAYALTIDETVTKDITVKIADLEVKSITTSQTNTELGESIEYKVAIFNNGPSDIENSTFDFVLPEGFSITSVNHSSKCGQVTSGVINAYTYQANVNLTNQCELTFTITAVANYPVPDEAYGQVEAFASILRPKDTTDPDATSILPINDIERTAIIECQNNGLGGNCNNIKKNLSVYLLERLVDRGSLTLIKTASHIDANGDRFKQVGELLRYNFTIRNNGFVKVSNLSLTDPLLSNTPIALPTRILDVGESLEVSVDYMITQADFDRESVENLAFITGTNPRGFTVKDISGTFEDNDMPTVTLIEKVPVLKLKKSVINKGTGTDGLFTIDDDIIYRLEISHSGKIGIAALKIEDPLISNEPIVFFGQRINNEVITSELRYKVNLVDINRGFVENSAIVRGVEELFSTEISDISGLTFDTDEPTITKTVIRSKAIDDNFWVYQNNESRLWPLLNDLSGSGKILPNSILITQTPTNGVSTVQPDGSIIYQPMHNYIGSDVIRYQVRDENRLWSTEAVINIDVRPTMPIAVVDLAEVWYNKSLEINVAKNDYVDGAVLDLNTIEIIKFPSNGTIVVLGNGLVRYEPLANYTGLDDFSYRIKDSNGWFSNAVVVNVLTKGLFIPNTFTPNGDGVNDTFELIGTYIFDRVDLNIYNRSGNLLYQESNYMNNWGGEGLLDGTYFYEINCHVNGKIKNTFKGSVTIISRIKY